MRAGIYCRVSSDRQRREATIETQSGANHAYCKRAGLQVVREYRDDGLSGTVEFSDRPGGSRLLADAGAGLLDVVVIYDTSRLGRDDYAVITPLTVAYLRSLGLEIHTPHGRLEDTPEGNLMLGIHANLDAFYRANLARLVADGKRRAVLEGRYTGHTVAYGYRVEGGRLVPDEEPIPGLSLSRAEVVRSIFRWIADEGLSCIQIARRLNSMGVPAPWGHKSGGGWRETSVGRLPHYLIYVGVHIRHVRGERYAVEVPPIVDRDLRERALACLLAKRSHEWGHTCHEYTLRRLIYCGLCGGVMQGQSCTPRGSGRRYCYYACPRRPATCTMLRVRTERVEPVVWADILEVAGSSEALARRVAARVAAAEDTEAGDAETLARLREALAGIGTQRDLILGLFRRRAIRQDALERQLADIDAEEAGLREGIAAIEARGAVAQRAAAAAQSLASTLTAMAGRLSPDTPPEQQRETIVSVIERVTVLPDAPLRIDYKF